MVSQITYYLRIDDDVRIKLFDEHTQQQLPTFRSTIITSDLIAKHRDFVKQGVNSASINAFGKILFDALFNTEARQHLVQALSDAARHIRLLLDFNYEKNALLSMLPWEMMNVNVSYGHDIYLSTSDRCSLLRYIAPEMPFVPREITVQIATASPNASNSNGYAPINIDLLWQKLLGLNSEKKLSVNPPVERCNSDRLTQASQQSHSIFHLVAHGEANPPRLVLVDSSGFPELYEARIIADKFSHNPPDAIILQTCNSAIADAQNYHIVAPFFSKQIPYLVAMQYPVAMHVANQFSSTFYHYLAEGLPLEQALQRGRANLTDNTQGYGSLDFVTPVFFTHVLRPMNNLVKAGEIPISKQSMLDVFPFVFDLTVLETWQKSINGYKTTVQLDYYEGTDIAIRRGLLDALNQLSFNALEELCAVMNYPCWMWGDSGAEWVQSLLRKSIDESDLADLDRELRRLQGDTFLPVRQQKPVLLMLSQDNIVDPSIILQRKLRDWYITFMKQVR